MDNNTFKKELDKITEREVVYDFVERIYIGKDMNTENNTFKIFPKNTLLIVILKSLFKLLPISLVKNIANLHSYEMVITANNPCPTVKFSSSKSITIFRAISDKTGMDISSCMRSSYSNGTVTITMTNDIYYQYSDNITIFVY